MKTKKCKKCNKIKDISCFSFRNKQKETYQSECKACFKLRDKDRWTNNPKLLKKKRSQQKLIRVRNREFIDTYKKQNHCVDCGEEDIRVLDFDHIKNKEYNVSDMLTVSIEKLKIEISKCEVRCANCHRKRHYLKRKELYE